MQDSDVKQREEKDFDSKQKQIWFKKQTNKKQNKTKTKQRRNEEKKKNDIL